MRKKYLAKRQRATSTSPDWASILYSPVYQPSIFMTLPSKAVLNFRLCHTTWRDLPCRLMFERCVNPPTSTILPDIAQLKEEFRFLKFFNKIHRHNQPLLKKEFDSLKKDTAFTTPQDYYTAYTQETTTKVINHPLLVYATFTDGPFEGFTPVDVAEKEGHRDMILLLSEAANTQALQTQVQSLHTQHPTGSNPITTERKPRTTD